MRTVEDSIHFITIPLATYDVISPVTVKDVLLTRVGVHGIVVQNHPPPPPLAFIVTESVDASVVIVILVPATKVSVSQVVSATTFDCPDTAIVENKFWSPVFVPLFVPVISEVNATVPLASLNV